MNIKQLAARIDKKKAAKKFVKITTAFAVGKAVKDVIRQHVPENDNPVVNFAVNVSVFVGGSVAAGYVIDTLAAYSDKQIDDFVAELQNALHPESEDAEIIIEGEVQ